MDFFAKGSQKRFLVFEYGLMCENSYYSCDLDVLRLQRIEREERIKNMQRIEREERIKNMQRVLLIVSSELFTSKEILFQQCMDKIHGLMLECETKFGDMFGSKFERCPITLELMKKPVKLPCGHIFGAKTIQLLESHTCPYCRRPF